MYAGTCGEAHGGGAGGDVVVGGGDGDGDVVGKACSLLPRWRSTCGILISWQNLLGRPMTARFAK